MTFTEAAVEVLRLVGKPLHYKRITEIAIERNLLSHVGKTPEVTMSSRLATMVKRDRGEAPIIKVKPGVFGLREFNEEQLADLSGDVAELPEVEEAASAPDEEAKASPAVSPAGRPLPGSDVFPEEEDDDEPIFGAPASSSSNEGNGGSSGSGGSGGDDSEDSEGRSSKRRRRRRKRGGRGDDGDEGSSSSRESNRESGRRRGRDRGGDRERDRERDREEYTGDWNRVSADGDVVGKDLADATAAVLQSGGRSGMAPQRVSERLVQKGRLSGDPSALVPTLMAAVRADLARAAREGKRPRFRLEPGRIVLMQSLLPQDVVRAEQEALRAAERHRERVGRAFLRRVNELPFAGLAELLATWLNAEGVVSLRAVRRPGSGSGELHMAGTFRRGLEETRLAIVFLRDAGDLGRERVIELRGSMHHYGNASAAWLITTGNVMSGARDEATTPGTAPVALFDGAALAQAMERAGVGLLRYAADLTALDLDLLDSLTGGGQRRVRDDRDDEEPSSRRRRDRRGGGADTEGDDDESDDGSEDQSEDASDDSGESGDSGDSGEGGRNRRRRRRRRGRGRDRESSTEGGSEGDDGDDDGDEGSEERGRSRSRDSDADADDGDEDSEAHGRSRSRDSDADDGGSDSRPRRTRSRNRDDDDQEDSRSHDSDDDEGEESDSRSRDSDDDDAYEDDTEDLNESGERETAYDDEEEDSSSDARDESEADYDSEDDDGQQPEEPGEDEEEGDHERPRWSPSSGAADSDDDERD